MLGLIAARGLSGWKKHIRLEQKIRILKDIIKTSSQLEAALRHSSIHIHEIKIRVNQEKDLTDREDFIYLLKHNEEYGSERGEKIRKDVISLMSLKKELGALVISADALKVSELDTLTTCDVVYSRMINELSKLCILCGLDKSDIQKPKSLEAIGIYNKLDYDAFNKLALDTHFVCEDFVHKNLKIAYEPVEK